MTLIFARKKYKFYFSYFIKEGLHICIKHKVNFFHINFMSIKVDSLVVEIVIECLVNDLEVVV